MTKFLTQKRLEELILKLFPQCHLIIDRVVPDSGVRFRPDFRCEEYKVIIEFDGFRHYSNAEVQNRDIIKDYSYEKMGYKIIRIPYFVQASRDLVILILNSLEISIPKNLDEILHEYEYPQGFIDDKAMLPIDFNEFGIELFKADLRKFWFLADEILKSLENKISSKGLPFCLPDDLEFLIFNHGLRKEISILKMCENDLDLTPEEKKLKERYDKGIEKHEKKELRKKKIERLFGKESSHK